MKDLVFVTMGEMVKVVLVDRAVVISLMVMVVMVVIS